jgi:SH3-like domain-containing protein
MIGGQAPARSQEAFRLMIFARFALVVAGLALSASLSILGANPARAEDGPNIGSVTKLPLPRFVSLKPSDTPMREGPSKEHRIKWVFKREGLPVEVIGEHEQWRRIRDSESTEGWVYFGRLSNRRTVIIRAGKTRPEQDLMKDDRETSAIVARLQPGVIAHVEACGPAWCKISVEGYAGHIRKDAVWGVYPDERVK